MKKAHVLIIALIVLSAFGCKKGYYIKPTYSQDSATIYTLIQGYWYQSITDPHSLFIFDPQHIIMPHIGAAWDYTIKNDSMIQTGYGSTERNHIHITMGVDMDTLYSDYGNGGTMWPWLYRNH